MRILKRAGFTLIELMIGLAIAAGLYTVMATYFFQKAQAERDQTFANLNKHFAIAYANYINGIDANGISNYGAILTLMGSSDIAVIPYSTIVAAGYVSSAYNPTTLSAPFKPFIPCLIVFADSTKQQLFPLMIDVTNNAANAPDIDSANSSSYLGDYAAYLRNSVFQSNSGWSINTTGVNASTYFSNPSAVLSQCATGYTGYSNLMTNSIAINLTMAPFFTQPLSDISLNRVKDTIDSGMGIRNQNVSKTDIILGLIGTPNTYSKIFFNNSNLSTAPYCADGLSAGIPSPYNVESNIVCPNSTVMADGFQSMATATIGSSCNNVGEIVIDGTAASPPTKKSTLVCSYNPVLCNVTKGTTSGNNTCYLSPVTRIVKYTSISSPFSCRAQSLYTPIAIDAETKTQLARVGYCLRNNNNCNAGGTVAYNRVIPYSSKLKGTALFTTTTITLPNGGGTVSVATGASDNLTEINLTRSGCATMCPAFFSVTKQGDGSGYCRCNASPDIVVEFGGDTGTSPDLVAESNLAATSLTPNNTTLNVGSTNLYSVTCSNKTVIRQ